jgi:GT2 family glycosyltransferase
MSSIAIALLSYNHPHHTQECLESILPHSEAREVYLIHNGSEKRWIDKLCNLFPQVHHLILSKNHGYSGGVNAGLRFIYQYHPWCALVTNDTKLLQLPPIKAIEELSPSFIAPLIWRRKIGKIDSMGGRFHPLKRKIWHCRSSEEFYQKRLFHFPYIPGTAFLLHREVFTSVGGMDESLHTYWEDVDFSMKVSRLGYPLLFRNDFQLLHKVGKTNHKNRFYTNYLFHRNKDLISLRYVTNWRYS